MAMDCRLMPTILRVGPYRFFFYSSDRDEPRHVHVERENRIVKFWLNPLRPQASGGFNRMEIRRIHRIIEDHHSRLVEAWNDYFGY